MINLQDLKKYDNDGYVVISESIENKQYLKV